jgi:HlyD family secretion protein
VRYSSTTVSNVVTYTVIVDAANPETLLFPGMTANVTFEVARSKETLRVPATALRLQPAAELIVSTDARPEAPADPAGAAMTAGPAMSGDATTPDAGRGGEARGRSGRAGGGGRRARGTVYVPGAGNRLKGVTVKLGVTDGALTAVEPVEAGALAEGAEVVTAIVKEEEAATKSPLTPTMGGPGSGRGGR